MRRRRPQDCRQQRKCMFLLASLCNSTPPPPVILRVNVLSLSRFCFFFLADFSFSRVPVYYCFGPFFSEGRIKYVIWRLIAGKEANNRCDELVWACESRISLFERPTLARMSYIHSTATRNIWVSPTFAPKYTDQRPPLTEISMSATPY